MRFFIPTLLFLSTFLPTPLKAQIVPDNTIGTILRPNMIINGVLSDKIEGGAQSGNNLFHSFSEFNINTGRGVYFTNPTDVTNIFTRVTGANLSNINGILGVEGNANLFLMNPNGIIFGYGWRRNYNDNNWKR
ncbi:filamentous hemagglutinin N-terminal domain-containing protein [Dulcicalothrix desertica]|nr:filamentous hemagglutinin N-terminal domain-containing protein [Dulcicalothrix desertica]TWH38878.1 filamentous hemagglutinin family protein [Dulcicalothrix desertica PCC 7102]